MSGVLRRQGPWMRRSSKEEQAFLSLLTDHQATMTEDPEAQHCLSLLCPWGRVAIWDPKSPSRCFWLIEVLMLILRKGLSQVKHGNRLFGRCLCPLENKPVDEEAHSFVVIKDSHYYMLPVVSLGVSYSINNNNNKFY